MAAKVNSRPASRSKPAPRSQPAAKAKPAPRSQPAVKAKPAVKTKPAAKTAPVVKVAKTKPKPAVNGEQEPLPESWLTPPTDQSECLERIQTLGERVGHYIKFMKKVDDVRGTSAEAKQKALSAFYDRLLYLEKELGRIQEELQLG